MAEQEVVKNMVLSFRVSELQCLLGYAGRNKSGRKPELQQRALELLHTRSTPIMMKIRDLHRRREQVSQGKASSELMTALDSGSLKSCNPYVSSNRNYTSMTPSTPIHYGSRSSDRLLAAAHRNDMNGSNVGFPVHPDVRVKSLPFYDVLAELMRPTSLVPSGNGRFQESHFIFHLTPQQAQDIALSREIRTSPSGGRLEHFTTQVQLRFCLLETSCEQDDNFPPSICVKINDKVCPLPNPIPTNKPGVEPKRPGRPVNITSLCRLSPIVSNYIDVSWASDLGRGYAVSAFLVNKITSTTLLSRLKSSGMRNADHTRALIIKPMIYPQYISLDLPAVKEKLTHDMDSEIATTSLKVSLMCPLGKSRMQLPCRASTCIHIQCFDAMLFLQMNEKKATWVCPVCDQTALFDKLVIDGLFLEIVREAPSECSEVKFQEDGTWSPLLAKKESQSAAKNVAPKVYNVPSSTEPPKKKPACEVVDLTLSSDEEDDEPIKPTKEVTINPAKKVPMIPYYSTSASYSSNSDPNEPTVVDVPMYNTSMDTSTSKTSIDNTTATSHSSSIASIAPSQDKHIVPPTLNSTSSSSSMNFYNSLPSLPNLDRELSSGLGLPSSSSPYPDYLSNPMFTHLPNFDLYSLLHMSGVDSHRPISQMSSRGSAPSTSHATSSSNHPPADSSPPDIIPLD